VEARVAATAACTPAAKAAGSPDRSLTYRELDRRASAIASALLRALPRGEWNPVVAIAAERSPEYLAAILGCWRAGAAYLPLDSSIPAARAEFMLADSVVSVVLSDRPGIPDTGATVVPLDGIRGTKDGEPARRASLDDVAYMIYTSGSTGRPKGVAVEHRSLNAYLDGLAARLELPPRTCWAAMSSFATDLAHTALFAPLATGGCTHVVPQRMAMDPAELAAYLAEAEIDSMKVTPSHLSALLGGSFAPVPSERLVLGGEALHRRLVERVLELAPGCAVFNHYGPTETTVGACVHRCDSGSHGLDHTVPIGRPLPHCTAYVLDEERRPARNGEGELYIGGAGVARGYVGLRETTAERFLDDPFARSGRMYRTGDRVRTLPTGELVFVGRVDDQLKVRGYRVEPGEVEGVLRSHPAVAQAAVVAEPGPGGDARLAAHVVMRAPTAPSDADLHEFLARSLPSYMLPTRVVVEESLPLLPSGKVDRAGLARGCDAVPAIAPSAGADVAKDVATRVLDLYREILAEPALAPTADFFAAGGTSLLAVRLAALVADRLGVQMPVAEVFLNPTPGEFASALSARAHG
jgi:amino acid adenylation domain-containing protein